MSRPLVLVSVFWLVLILALSSCAQPQAAAESRPPDGGASGDPPAPSAADGATAPEVSGIEGLQAYGLEHPDEYGGLFIDPPGGRHVVMLFTANLERHARAVEAIHPETTVRGVEHTEAQLTAAIEGIDYDELMAGGIEVISAAVDIVNNRVRLEGQSKDPTAELRLELAFGGLVDVTIFPVPGDWQHVAEGDGWRLVATGQVAGNEAYAVRAATDADEWRAMWDEIGLEGARPSLDLAEAVVVSFGHGIGSSCPEIRLDGVVIAGDLVHSATSDPLGPRACTADLAGASVFVVAVSRDALPGGGFTLRLREESATCPDCGFTEEIEVSLP